MKKFALVIGLVGVLGLAMIPKAHADGDDWGAGMLGFALGAIAGPPVVVYRQPPPVIYEAPDYDAPPPRAYYYYHGHRDWRRGPPRREWHHRWRHEHHDRYHHHWRHREHDDR